MELLEAAVTVARKTTMPGFRTTLTRTFALLALLLCEARAGNAEITNGAALEDAIGGDRPVLALFCTKSAHMCVEHLLGAFDELALRRDDVVLASLSGTAERKLVAQFNIHAYPMMKWWPAGGKLANPEAFYLVHYGGEYVDTLEGLIDKKLGAHSEL